MANTRMKLKELIKKINKENAPPEGWNLSDKPQATSYRDSSRKRQASSPKLQASSFKPQATSSSIW